MRRATDPKRDLKKAGGAVELNLLHLLASIDRLMTGALALADQGEDLSGLFDEAVDAGLVDKVATVLAGISTVIEHRGQPGEG